MRKIDLVVRGGLVACVAWLGACSSSSGAEDVGAGTDAADAQIEEDGIVPPEEVSPDLPGEDTQVGDPDLEIPDDRADPDVLAEAGEVANPLPFPLLAQPEGVLAKDGHVFAANINGAWDAEQNRMIYGPGYVTVFDADGLAPAKQIDTGFLNPQYVVDLGPEGHRVAIACSGSATVGADWTMTPAASGAVVVLDSSTLKEVGSVEIPGGVPVALAGFPGAAAFHEGTGALFLGSGTSSYLFKVDVTANGFDALAPQAIEIYPLAGNDIITPATFGDRLFAASFNQGLVYEVVPATGEVLPDPVDVTETDDLEGPIHMVEAQGALYVLLTISTEVRKFDPLTGDVEDAFAAGATPNRLAFADGGIFCVNSGDNNLSRFDLATEELASPFAVFDVGTNPWELAIDGDYGYVTGYVSNTLLKVSLEDGKIVQTVTNE